MRLTSATVDQCSGSIRRPSYDRARQKAGIVHFGIGAFHRAHQAVYTDDAMNAGEQDWGIIGVSLRSTDVALQVNPQDGLYTVAVRSGQDTCHRVVGAVQEVINARQSRAGLLINLIAPQCHIVSFTVTEKGYCRKTDGSLDLDMAKQGSIYSILAEAMRERRAAGIGGWTMLSCDNLAHNGAQLHRLMLAFLEHTAPDLINWFENECACPSTMVDRIVPATTEADLVAAQSALGGLRDEAHVVTESFSQWVIEDRFAGPRPRWEEHGAEIVSDVAPYEAAKLRMLNGAHSALAYIGLGRGHEFVHQAIADPQIRPLIERLMREEAAPSIAVASEQDLGAYAAALVTRFENPQLNHRLGQIAMDGSQKIPQRWLETLAFHQQAGRQCPAILTALGAWLCHIRGDNGVVDDPIAAALRALWDQAGKDSIVTALFASDGPMASAWEPSHAERAMITPALT